MVLCPKSIIEWLCIIIGDKLETDLYILHIYAAWDDGDRPNLPDLVT
jgi:hypothetical protein